jgi:MFS family permease
MRSEQSLSTQIGTLVIATSGIQLANGFFNTFISLRVALESFEALTAGLVLSSYFAGFAVGAMRCGAIIARIGHIRAYAAFAGLVVATTAAMALIVAPAPWLALRAAIGFGCAGVFVTTESWLNAKAHPARRGRVFALYMVGTFIGLAGGQLLIARATIETAAPFSIIVVLFATALVMVSATHAEPPRTIAAPRLAHRQIARAAPVAVAGVALSGFISSAFYALVPAWMQGEGIAYTAIGTCMLAAVLGGLAFQVPVGWVSDRFDRRKVLALLGAGLAVAAVALVQLPHSLTVILPAIVVLGGTLSTLYPVCVAHAHDRMPADRVLAVSSSLILVNGIGAVLGPLIGTIAMRRFDIDGVLIMMGGAAGLLTLLALGGSLAAPSPRRLERPFTVLAPELAALAHAAGERDAAELAPQRA